MSNKTPQESKDVRLKTLAALLVAETKTQAAEMLGIHRKTLWERIEKFGLQDYLDEVQEDAIEVLRKGTVSAAQNLVKKVSHANPNISMEASREVLDRAGITKPKELNQTNVQVNNFIPLLGGDSAKDAVRTDNSNREDTTTQQED